MPLRSIALRQQIYSAILEGRITEALEGLNQIDSMVCHSCSNNRANGYDTDTRNESRYQF